AATLLREGSVRVKNTLAAGGGGQTVIHTVQELESVLGEIAPPHLEGYGLVFERDLVDATTNSVGQVRIGRCVASYYGTQQLTLNNRGHYCYGGSDLVVIRGGYRQLLELDLGEPMRLAVTQAMTYDRAVGEHYPEAILSRRNYDIIQGWDQHGRWHSGVLEQSWRIGGASGPEVAALLAFEADPSLRVVRVASVERYGDGVVRPVDCRVHFDGIDPVEGRMQSYTAISACERRLPSRNRGVARARQRQLAPLVGR
ncbi:MAG: DUF3182 family protein, partial [Chloroflexi bacterium]|nr:DUF3182 family protein [Chloroflexota bacterium]